jgi:hypothetical protein
VNNTYRPLVKVQINGTDKLYDLEEITGEMLKYLKSTAEGKDNQIP